MTPKQWKALCAQVTDAMKAATRPFVTPLIHEASGEPTRIGSAAYVELTSDGVSLITCEHVARYQNQRHLPFGRKRPVPLTGTACTDRLPLDVASIRLNGQSWQDQSSKARALPWARFAQKHAPADDEILFFYGLAGENSYSFYGKFSNIMTGYCTQEKRNTGDDDIFEMFWEPENTSLSPQTSSKIKQDFKYDDAQGFSGSLVWNTRFVEKGSDINRWSPADALVTGLLRRWDPATRTLLVWRVEHLRKWLAARPSWA
jgi:hypothetical protein